MTTVFDRPIEEQIAQWRAYVRRDRPFTVRRGGARGHLRDQLVALTENRPDRG